MAKLQGEVIFTGTLGDISAYRMHGVDRIIIRRKGGPSKKKIKTHKNFDLVRRNNSEFGGRAAAAKCIMHGLHEIKPLGDYNVSGPLNGLMKSVQILDRVSTWGERGVALSKNAKILEGFSFNKNIQFDSAVRIPVSCTIDRLNLSAKIELPTLVPGINLFTPRSNPLFAITVTLSAIPDVHYSERTGYSPSPEYSNILKYETFRTEWHAITKGMPAAIIELQLPKAMPDEGFSLMVSIGICYGQLEDALSVKQVKRAGSAKVLGVM